MGEIGKKLPFNVRIPVLTACALAAGITLGCLFLRYGITLTWIIAVVPVAALAFICGFYQRLQIYRRDGIFNGSAGFGSFEPVFQA